MNASDQALLSKLMTLLDALSRGDVQARDGAAKLKAAAKRGDKAAQKAWNTLSSLYWGRMSGGTHMTPTTQRPPSGTWVKAEAFYAKLLAKDPGAVARFRAIQQGALVGILPSPRTDEAKKALAILKSIHNHRKASVWYPGAPVPPSIGYSMPHRHRPGIVTGGPFDSVPGLPGGFDPRQIPGLGGFDPRQIPGLGGSIPGLPGGFDPSQFLPPGTIPGFPPPAQPPSPFPGQFPGQLPAGFDPRQLGGLLASPEAQALGRFLPLTPQSASSLLSMIAQARQSPGRGGGGDLQTFTQPGGFAPGGAIAPAGSTAFTTATANIMSTIPKATTALSRAWGESRPGTPVDAGVRVILTNLGRAYMDASPEWGPMLRAIKQSLTDPDVQRGFDIGVGYLWGDPRAAQLWPDDVVRRGLQGGNLAGFDRAVFILHSKGSDGTPIDGTTRSALAARGASIGQQNRTVSAVRATVPPGPAQRGFDIGVALGFGPRTPFDAEVVGYTLNPADGTKQGFDRAVTLARTGQ